MYHSSQTNKSYERSQPLNERVKFRNRKIAQNKVIVQEYKDSPLETFKRVQYLIKDSQDNIRYCYQLRDFALAITKKYQAKTNDERIAAIYDWVKKNMEYLNDPYYNELIHSSEVLMNEFLRTGRVHGDCDDFTILICSLLLSIGIPCRARMIKLPNHKGHQQWAHIYPMALSERTGEWIALDATEKDKYLGWEPPHNSLTGRRDHSFI